MNVLDIQIISQSKQLPGQEKFQYWVDAVLKDASKFLECNIASESGMHVYDERLEMGFHGGDILYSVQKVDIESIRKAETTLGFALEILVDKKEMITFYPAASLSEVLSSTRNQKNIELLIDRLQEKGYLVK